MDAEKDKKPIIYEKYKFIEDFKNEGTPISLICKTLKITRRSYYQWCKRKKPNYEGRIYDEDLLKAIAYEFGAENCLYGYVRIHIKLEKCFKVSASTIYRYMKHLGLKSSLREKSNFSKPAEPKVKNKGIPNLTNQQWWKFKINECWVTDVKYILMGDKWLYLSIIKDVASGFLVGWHLSEKNDLRLYIDNWKKAKKYRTIETVMIIHSDNGSQYTTDWMKRYARKHNLQISVSEPGNSLDNAVAETFFSQLVHENPGLEKCHSFAELHQLIDDYVTYYNYDRIVVKHRCPPASVYLPYLIKEKLAFQNLRITSFS